MPGGVVEITPTCSAILILRASLFLVTHAVLEGSLISPLWTVTKSQRYNRASGGMRAG